MIIPQSHYFPGILYSHYGECDLSKWKNFSFEGDPRLYCKLSKEFYLHIPSMDALQAGRDNFGKPIVINSGHRSAIYNAMVRGQPKSAHKFLAFDIDHRASGYNRMELAMALKAAGFQGFGFYNSFIHVDLWRKRYWFGSPSAKRLWKEIDWSWLKD